jgi:hypothetical protein
MEEILDSRTLAKELWVDGNCHMSILNVRRDQLFRRPRHNGASHDHDVSTGAGGEDLAYGLRRIDEETRVETPIRPRRSLDAEEYDVCGRSFSDLGSHAELAFRK